MTWTMMPSPQQPTMLERLKYYLPFGKGGYPDVPASARASEAAVHGFASSGIKRYPSVGIFHLDTGYANIPGVASIDPNAEVVPRDFRMTPSYPDGMDHNPPYHGSAMAKCVGDILRAAGDYDFRMYGVKIGDDNRLDPFAIGAAVMWCCQVARSVPQWRWVMLFEFPCDLPSVAMTALKPTLAANIPVVVPAGNNGSNIDLNPVPAVIPPNVLVAAYCDADGNLHPRSNYGPRQVQMAIPCKVGAGTSWSAAVGAAWATWVLAQNPASSASQVVSRIIQASLPNPTLVGKVGTGRYIRGVPG